MTVEPSAEDMQVAMGVSAHALVVEMLVVLRVKGLLTESECARIIDNALASVKNLDRAQPTTAFQLAGRLLEIQARRWNPGGRVEP